MDGFTLGKNRPSVSNVSVYATPDGVTSSFILRATEYVTTYRFAPLRSFSSAQ